MVRAELGLQGVLVAGVLDELADAEARILVHHREAAAALGQSLARELQARIADRRSVGTSMALEPGCRR